MTNEEAISMVEAKLDCLQRSTSGTDIMCNARDCDNCALNYAQGNMGEQKEWLKLAINALHNQARTGHIISVREESNAYPWDDDYIEPLYVCSECRTRLLPQWGIKYCEHCGVRFEQIKKGE